MPYEPKQGEFLVFPPRKLGGDKPRQCPQLQDMSFDWLERTWTVTHSTLPMWRKSKNVRITYKKLPAKSGGDPRVDDTVEHELRSSGEYKVIHGIDTPDKTDKAAFKWRGSGLLGIASSQWEVLGYGESSIISDSGEDLGVERWVVTWFASTIATPEGVDIYCDRPEGLRAETHNAILEAVNTMEDTHSVRGQIQKDLFAVDIELPWAAAKPRSWWN